jgi:hypothetical protein
MNSVLVSKISPIKAAILCLLAFLLVTCSSMHPTVIYDRTIPETEQSVLIVGKHLMITSFDGAKVIWRRNTRIHIPAGKHSIGFDFYESEQTGNKLHTYSDINSISAQCIPSRIYELTARRTGLIVFYVVVDRSDF